MKMPTGLLEAYQTKFKGGSDDLWVSRAPGRVEVLGNHTDYNSGLVLAGTINRFVWTLGRSSDEVSVHSMNLDKTVAFEPTQLKPSAEIHWDSYVKGIYWSLLRRKHAVKGVNGVILGDVPIGAGLSSSAALEVSLVNLIARTSGLTLNPKEAAMIAFEAERLFCGISCGVMDQFTSQLGKPESLLAINCSNLQTKNIPLSSDAKLVIVDSKVSRSAGEVLNDRRAECLEALNTLNECGWELNSLSGLTAEQLSSVEEFLEDKIFRRVTHVVLENARVREGINALETGDLRRFGVLLYESHESSKELYEVSHPRLDLLVDIARSNKAVYGSRMTGAGLGGATLSVVANEYVSSFAQEITSAYQSHTGDIPDVLVSIVPGGVTVERFELT
jgi:galactokinase